MSSASDKATLYMVRGVIASCTEREQKQVAEAAEQLRELVAKHGDAGWVALSLVAAEKAAE